MNRIRSLREDRDLRQTDVALATGIDQKTLSNYETGKTNPDSDILIRLADFFGVSIDYLVGRDTPHALTQAELVQELTRIECDLHTLKKRIAPEK